MTHLKTTARTKTRHEDRQKVENRTGRSLYNRNCQNKTKERSKIKRQGLTRKDGRLNNCIKKKSDIRTN